MKSEIEDLKKQIKERGKTIDLLMREKGKIKRDLKFYKYLIKKCGGFIKE